MIVKIFKVAEANTENELVSTLPIGKHVVGRETLQVTHQYSTDIPYK